MGFDFFDLVGSALRSERRNTMTDFDPEEALYFEKIARRRSSARKPSGVYPYDQLAGVGGQVKKDAKKQEAPTRFALVEVEVIHMETGEKMCVLERVPSTTTVRELKELFEKKYPAFYPERQAFFLDKRSPAMPNNDCLATHGMTNECQLLFHDLGAQSAWNTVFFYQYLVPLIIYLMFYFTIWPVSLIDDFEHDNDVPFTHEFASHFAMIAHTIHYGRRLFEVAFVHKFSSATLAVRHIPKYCLFYGACTAWMAYVINHPQFTPPNDFQVFLAFIVFLAAEIGALSIHLILRNNYKNRHIPVGNWNPFTWLFNLVSCPNYTYELLAWISFTAMTNCAIVGINTFIIFIQLFIWSAKKHSTYKKRFVAYPSNRRAFIPGIF